MQERMNPWQRPRKATTTEEIKDDGDGSLPALLDGTKTTGNDKRLSDKLKEDEKHQTRSASKDKVENEGKKTGEAPLHALDWSDKNQLNEKDEFEAIKTEECQNSTLERATLDEHARQEDTRRICFDIMAQDRLHRSADDVAWLRDPQRSPRTRSRCSWQRSHVRKSRAGERQVCDSRAVLTALDHTSR